MKMSLDQINEIEKNPLAVARKIVQLEQDIELLLTTIEREDPKSCVAYNVRQRYPKKS